MRFTALLLACAATAAHSHDAVDLPELPIPAIDQLFPVDDMTAAFRWADREPLTGNWATSSRPTLPWWTGAGNERRVQRGGELEEWDRGHRGFCCWVTPNRWHVVELSESQFEQVSEILAGIQQPQDNRESEFYNPPVCDQDERFGVYLLGRSRGGIQDFSSGNAAQNGGEGDAILWTVGYGLHSYGKENQEVHTNHHLKNRFSVVGGLWDGDTELRDSGFSMQFSLTITDNAVCSGYHDHGNDHVSGNRRHSYSGHTRPPRYGPWTDWIPIADLLDGNVAGPPPAAPEQPADNGDDTGNDDTLEESDTGNDDALARLRAELDALRGDLAAVRDSVAWLSDLDLDGLPNETITRVDTVEIVRRDTLSLYYCLPTDQERQDLFDAFTGVNEDSTGGAGKAAAVRPSSWGAIKALMQE